jgi:hypothetical protein
VTTTKPSAAEVGEHPSWLPPAERSKRCAWLLGRLERGLWRPSEATIWREDREAAKRAGVFEWEWRNVLMRAWCERTAALPDCPYPVVLLPHCPNQPLIRCDDRWKGRQIEGLCVCPEPDPDAWGNSWHRTHWVSHEGTVLYCHCGPREEPAPGSGFAWINGDGYVCESCARLLVTTHHAWGWDGREVTGAGHVGEGPSWSHPLKCDCRCCYCGGLAKERRGWRLNGHPALALPVAADAVA